MDDDELLTPYTCFEKHLRFLMTHPQADLVGVLPLSAPWCTPVSEIKKAYYAQPMNEAPRRLKIPHMTRMESGYTVLGKVPNIFIVRTDVMKRIGYDDHIRMIDHNDFFYRAAGRMVSVLAEESFVFHDHNRFNRAYQRYRADVAGDRRYIAQRNYVEMMKYMAENRNKHEGNTTPEAGRNKQ